MTTSWESSGIPWWLWEWLMLAGITTWIAVGISAVIAMWKGEKK